MKQPSAAVDHIETLRMQREVRSSDFDDNTSTSSSSAVGWKAVWKRSSCKPTSGSKYVHEKMHTLYTAEDAFHSTIETGNGSEG